MTREPLETPLQKAEALLRGFDPAARERAWRRPAIALCLYPVLGALIALLVPEDLLSRSAFLTSVCNAVASVIPSLKPLAHIATYPGVMTMYLAAMWLCYPLAVAWMIYAAPPVPDYRLPLRQWLLVTFLSVPVLFMLFIAWPVFYTAWEPVHLTPSSGRGQFFLLELTGSRLGTALLGGFFFYCSALVCYLLVWAAPQVLIWRLLSHPTKR